MKNLLINTGRNCEWLRRNEDDLDLIGYEIADLHHASFTEQENEGRKVWDAMLKVPLGTVVWHKGCKLVMVDYADDLPYLQL